MEIGGVLSEAWSLYKRFLGRFFMTALAVFVVLGGGIGANGDLLLDPVDRRLREWLPFPPRVEVSTLGDAAILTGALAVGLQTARENVFSIRT